MSNNSEEYWSLSSNDILKQFDVDEKNGLNEVRVSQLLNTFGKNVLAAQVSVSKWRILWQQIKSLVVLLLLVASAVSLLLGHYVESASIVGVIIINTLIGFFTELKAIRSMEALRELGQIKTKVKRGGQIHEILADNIVPGDIVIFEAGDVVTADLRLIESSNLSLDESTLTGESLPIGKQEQKLDKETSLADRRNMLYKGTSVVRGRGKGIVVTTGLKTELGKISEMVGEAKEEKTPLEMRLDELGQKLVWFTLCITAFITLVGTIAGKDIVLMFETSVALAVAAIPEGLPIVATLALALGMLRMAKKQVLINKLSAVETLGATTTIFTDKTGTLTENEMKVSNYLLEGGLIKIERNKDGQKVVFKRESGQTETLEYGPLKKAIEIGNLCNNAEFNSTEDKYTGDPIEVALLTLALEADFDHKKHIEACPRVKEEAFDSDSRMMATFHRCQNTLSVAVKGAAEAVLGVSNDKFNDNSIVEFDERLKEEWEKKGHALAEKGLRVLALAYKENVEINQEPYQNLIFVGYVGVLDPPRHKIDEAIRLCRGAGVNVIMVTGDQQGTAVHIANEIGLIGEESGPPLEGKEFSSSTEKLKETSVFYRVTPKEKLDLIKLFQERGEVVAMIGDGVNDAPALKKADIGVAMGKRGTQVAKDAADMILKDDNFNSLVLAIEQGRIIFSNIRKFVVYLLSCNFSEIFIVFVASIVNSPLPILPLQILFLNLITDVFPALAIGVGRGSTKHLSAPPRRADEEIINTRCWILIVVYGIIITAVVLAVFYLCLFSFEYPQQKAVTISFLTLGFSQLFHVFNMREANSGFLINDLTKNPFVWGALILCTVLLYSAPNLEFMSQVLKLQPLNAMEWSIVIVASLVPLILGQLLKPLENWRYSYE